jgi:DNA-binding CsgD family transcriptional regulator
MEAIRENQQQPTGSPAPELHEGLGAGLALLMDELAHGVLVVNPEGRLLHANHAARQELARRQGLLLQDQQLQAHDADQARLLAEALAKAVDGKRSLITLAVGRDARLSIAVLPLSTPGLGRPARIALVLARATVCESLMLCFFARNHGLTGAEEQVLGFLCQGYTAPETARQLKVAVSTVRSHVRSLCAKTGSSGMRELVTRVAVLPPVSPVWQEAFH